MTNLSKEFIAPTESVLRAVAEEREAQDAKWGEQNHPDGTGLPEDAANANLAREICQRAFATGQGTFADILTEEVMEAFAETDKAKLREELIQVAAVAVAWAEKIDRGH